MTRSARYTKTTRFGSPIRGLMVLAVILGLGAFQAPHARSGYEVPIIDSSTTNIKAEFRGVWSFNRATDATRYGLRLKGDVKKYEGYEAYAVGVDPTNPNPSSNGVFFLYDGKKWIRPAEAFLSNPLNGFGMNTITGQGGNGYGGPMLFVGGANHRAAVWTSTVGQIGDYIQEDIATPVYLDRFTRLAVSGPRNPETIATLAPRDFYAASAVQAYGGYVLMGGQTDGRSYTNPVGTKLNLWLAADQTSARGTLFAHGDFGGVSLAIPGVINDNFTFNSASENITGIHVLDSSTAYLVTSTFTGNNRYNFDGMNCTNPASQRWRLYRVRVDGSDTWKDWERLYEGTGCAYSVVSGLREQGKTRSPVGDRLPHIVWVGTDNGIFEYREPTGITLDVRNPASTPKYTTLGTAPNGISRSRYKKDAAAAQEFYYSVTAQRDRGGNGISLIDNGEFERWLADDKTPSGWIRLFPNNVEFYNGGANCTEGNNEYVKQTDSTNYIEVWPFRPYRSDGIATGCSTVPLSDPDIGNFGVFTISEYAPFAGQKIRVSGRYKVRFESHNPSDSRLALPNYASGGVVVKCGGGNDQAGRINASRTGFNRLDCTLHNRSLVKTYINEGSNILNEEMDDWEQFELVLSRDDLLLSNYTDTYPTSQSPILIAPRRFDIQVNCEATYGARVWCDDIKVEEFTDPPAKARNTYYVAGVGKSGTVFSSDDALSTSPVYNIEATPTVTLPNNSTSRFNAIHASGVQHVFVVGSTYDATNTPTGQWNASIFSRIPSTLKGFIQVGTVDPGMDPALMSPSGDFPRSGVISVGCLNSKDPTTKETLCIRSSDSYGISLELNNTTKTGFLRGRAWFGKDIGPNTYTDNEIANVGTCIDEGQLAARADPTNKPYDLTGVCDTRYRLCFGNDPRFLPRTHAPVSCRSDFDCYGRCSNDGGRICVGASDCTYGPTSDDDIIPGETTGILVKNPGKQLRCTIDSPQSCTSFGWLSLDPGDASGTDPVGQVAGVSYNTLATEHNASNTPDNKGGHEFSGSAQFLTPATFGRGWVSFRGSNLTAGQMASEASNGAYFTIGGENNMYACQDCFGSGNDIRCAFCTNDNNRSCRPSNIANEANCSKVCSDLPHNRCENDGDCTSGKCVAGGVCQNNRDQFCTTNNDCGTGDVCLNGLMCKTTNASCAAYGVNYSSVRGQYSGYAWSEDYGWLSFANVGNAGVAYLQTRLGDIRAGGSIGDATAEGQLPSADTCNSTYLIISGTGNIASNWCSALSYTVGASESGFRTEAAVPLPASTNFYTNALGRIDIDGLATVVDGGSNNKYGQEVVNIATASGDIAAPWKSEMLNRSLNTAVGYSLGGKVYEATCASDPCTFTLDSELLVSPGDLNTRGSGAGVLIVRGNLRINARMAYTSETIDDARELASLAIIVDGDITVNSAVKDIVGAYFTVPNTTTPRTFYSTDGSLSTVNLNVSGLLVAQQFVFRRPKGGTVSSPAPSELVVYDGRLQANPPAGLIDFTRALPVTQAQP